MSLATKWPNFQPIKNPENLFISAELRDSTQKTTYVHRLITTFYEHHISRLPAATAIPAIMTDKSQFEPGTSNGLCEMQEYLLMVMFWQKKGHQVPVHQQERPGFQYKMPDPKPVSDHLPTDDGGYQLYKAAGKLKNKRAVITGGDSGIGRAVAVLYAMEGASSLIVYLESEEKDAQETKREVENYGGKCFLFATDLRKKENCKAVIDKAVEQLGGIDILVNNAAFQKMLPDIKDLSEYVLSIS